jgi:hypothetical protein
VALFDDDGERAALPLGAGLGLRGMAFELRSFGRRHVQGVLCWLPSPVVNRGTGAGCRTYRLMRRWSVACTPELPRHVATHGDGR